MRQIKREVVMNHISSEQAARAPLGAEQALGLSMPSRGLISSAALGLPKRGPELAGCLLGSAIGYLQGKDIEHTENARLSPMMSKEAILESAHRHGIRTILPIDLKEQRVVFECAAQLKEEGIQFLLSAPETVQLCNNKREFWNHVNAAGLGRYLPKVLSEIVPPCVIKQAEDDWGKNTHVVLSNYDKERLSILMEGKDHLIQEYIPGDHEFASHILCVNGEIVRHYAFKNFHGKEFYVQGIRDKEASTTHVTPSPEVEQGLKAVLKLLGYSGICCIDYKVGPDGLPKIFEINPRLGATLGLNKRLLTEMLSLYEEAARIAARASDSLNH
jgi:carbamoylphosphate synthase large subunit